MMILQWKKDILSVANNSKINGNKNSLKIIEFFLFLFIIMKIKTKIYLILENVGIIF